MLVFFSLTILSNGYSQTQKKCEEYSENTIEKVNSCFVSGNYAKSEEAAKAFLLNNKGSARGNALLAYSLTKQNKHNDSLGYYERAIGLGANTFDIYAYYALSLDAVGKLDEAIQYNQKALRIYPNLYDVSKSLAEQLERKNDFDGAIKVLQNFDAIQSSKGRRPIFSNQINLLSSKRDASNKVLSGSSTTKNNSEEEYKNDDEKKFINSCERIIPKNKILVGLNANYFVEKNKSLADITMIRSGHGSASFGLTVLKTNVNFRSNYTNQRLASNLWCGLVNLDISINASEFIIYIANEYKEGTCEYLKILEHEMEHANFHLKALNEVKGDIEKKMKEKYLNKILFVRGDGVYQGRPDLNEISAMIEEKMESYKVNHKAVDENLSWDNILKTCRN